MGQVLSAEGPRQHFHVILHRSARQPRHSERSEESLFPFSASSAPLPFPISALNPSLHLACARANNLPLNLPNSSTKPSASRPANVAASISVVNKIDVATSALHSQQYVSPLPGNSTNSPRLPHTLHCFAMSSSLPFGPHTISRSSCSTAIPSRAYRVHLK
jgi:hypothetical protein